MFPYLIIDVEATCWEKGFSKDGKGNQHEIIEIGLAILSPDKVLLHNEGWFVRPILHPELSEFCKTLTSISQSDVDTAQKFPEVMRQVEGMITEVTGQSIKECLFVSWGDYDRNQFESDCTLHTYPYPFGNHFNLKRDFMNKYSLKRAGVKRALEKLNLSFQGTHHRGVDDAMNISRIFREY